MVAHATVSNATIISNIFLKVKSKNVYFSEFTVFPRQKNVVIPIEQKDELQGYIHFVCVYHIL